MVPVRKSIKVWYSKAQYYFTVLYNKEPYGLV